MGAMPARLSPAVRNHWTITGRCPETGWNECPRRASNLHPNSALAPCEYACCDIRCGSSLAGRPTVGSGQLIAGVVYGPDALKVIGQAFDEAWRDIAGNFGDDPPD